MEPRDVLVRAARDAVHLNWPDGLMHTPGCDAVQDAVADAILAAMPDHAIIRRDEWERLRTAARNFLAAWPNIRAHPNVAQPSEVAALRAALGGSDAKD